MGEILRTMALVVKLRISRSWRFTITSFTILDEKRHWGVRGGALVWCSCVIQEF